MSDEDSDQVLASYRNHVNRIARELPSTLLLLATDVSLHDALFMSVMVANRRAEIEMQLRCGDNTMGYYDLTIVYQGVRRLDPPAERLVELLNSQNPEILYDEIDVIGNEYEHRMLLYPYSEIMVQFDGIGLQQTRVESRSVGMGNSPMCRVT